MKERKNPKMATSVIGVKQMAQSLQQYTYGIQCSKCFAEYPVSFMATSVKASIKVATDYQKRNQCSKCKGEDNTAASRELQASGLADMYRPIQNKPFAVDTNYDADGTPKKEWRNYESKTERALRECSASVQGTQVERFWFEGTLEAFMSL